MLVREHECACECVGIASQALGGLQFCHASTKKMYDQARSWWPKKLTNFKEQRISQVDLNRKGPFFNGTHRSGWWWWGGGGVRERGRGREGRRGGWPSSGLKLPCQPSNPVPFRDHFGTTHDNSNPPITRFPIKIETIKTRPAAIFYFLGNQNWGKILHHLRSRKKAEFENKTLKLQFLQLDPFLTPWGSFCL